MKNLKRIFWFAAGIIIGAKYIINYRQAKKEEKEHQLILRLLIKSDKRIKKLIENEHVEKRGIRFIKHPESKDYSDREFQWKARSDNSVKIPIRNNSIIPSDKDKQLFYLAHEIGHVANKGNGYFWKKRLCNHTIGSCLIEEMEADIFASESLEKINVKLNKYFWLENFKNVLTQCEKCSQLIDKGECPNDEIAKIKKDISMLFALKEAKND